MTNGNITSFDRRLTKLEQIVPRHGGVLMHLARPTDFVVSRRHG
jgi:hypothetical protein